MSIIIKGVEMPESCSDCPIKGDAYCRLTREKVKYHHEYRHDLCPLVELPPHGDLIDRDEFVKSQCNSCDGSCECVECDCLNCEQSCRCDLIVDAMNAPVVVPAERREG